MDCLSMTLFFYFHNDSFCCQLVMPNVLSCKICAEIHLEVEVSFSDLVLTLAMKLCIDMNYLTPPA